MPTSTIRRRRPSMLTNLRALGFDQSYHLPFTRQYHAGCSQCEALVINGIPTHETGCPHQTYSCRGCGATLDTRARYCPDCA